MNWIIHNARKLITAVIGTLLVLLGIVMLPYPGPGWLVIFSGLAVLATEFKFAKKVLADLTNKYEQWQKWFKRQNLVVKFSITAVTGVVIILTAWLLNTFGMINNILNLHISWLDSPLIK